MKLVVRPRQPCAYRGQAPDRDAHRQQPGTSHPVGEPADDRAPDREADEQDRRQPAGLGVAQLELLGSSAARPPAASSDRTSRAGGPGTGRRASPRPTAAPFPEGQPRARASVPPPRAATGTEAHPVPLQTHHSPGSPTWVALRDRARESGRPAAPRPSGPGAQPIRFGPGPRIMGPGAPGLFPTSSPRPKPIVRQGRQVVQGAPARVSTPVICGGWAKFRHLQGLNSRRTRCAAGGGSR